MATSFYEASYKGVSFEVESNSITTGRRSVVFEYPYKDAPFVEDLGKKTKSFTVNAFVTGSDYIAKAENLIRVLEEEGKGVLSLPQLGEIEAYVQSVGTVSFDNQERLASLSVIFIESGELQNPSTSFATDFLSRLSADNIINSVSTVFKQGYQAFKDIQNIYIDLDRALTNVTAQVNNVLNLFTADPFNPDPSFKTALREFKLKVNDLLSGDKERLENETKALIDLSYLATSKQNFRDITFKAIETYKNPILAHNATKPRNETEQLIINNINHFNGLVRNALLSNSVGISSVIGTKNDTDNNKNILSAPVYIDVVTAKKQLINALNLELDISLDVKHVYALQEARSNVWNDLSHRAENIESLESLELTTPKPVLLVAYELYGNADRANEIIDRNRILSPCFISGSIKVLKDNE